MCDCREGTVSRAAAEAEEAAVVEVEDGRVGLTVWEVATGRETSATEEAEEAAGTTTDAWAAVTSQSLPSQYLPPSAE